MSFIKCFDVVSEVVEEATRRFAPLWKLDEENYNILEDYCSVFDSLAEEFDGEAFEVSVDETAMTIAVTMECMVIDITSATHKFYSLVQRSMGFTFSTSEEGNLNVKFLFPSVWVKC